MRVAVYVRVSTLRQAQTQAIEAQLERLRAYSEAQGWALPEEHVFRDDGYSGATLNRPALDRLRDKVRAAELDRVARDRSGPAGAQLCPADGLVGRNGALRL